MNIFGIKKNALSRSERILEGNKGLLQKAHAIVGITRVRNESLILEDTLNHMACHVDAIVAYDDASTDKTLEILVTHPKVALVISNSVWEPEMMARLQAETRHRELLRHLARKRLRFEWILCFDADERYIGEIRNFVETSAALGCDGVRIQLFDAYMAPDDCAPYNPSIGKELINFRKYFGPERRDILMLWKNSKQIIFDGLDAREPKGVSLMRTSFYCQHYGKALSVKHWEDTCDYYIKHFPFETYGQKWLSRKGKAIHLQSDFGRALYAWGPELFANATVISN